MGGGLVVRLSTVAAFLGSFAISFAFVASLYLWKLLGYSDLNRDATGTIQRRFVSAFLTCVCSAALIYCLAEPEDGGFTFAELIGMSSPETGRASVQSLALTAALFIGPLAQHAISVAVGESPFVSFPFGMWVALRNFLLAPFMEEFVFRACLVRLLVAASMPKGIIVLCSLVFFSLAHTHHYIEHTRRLQNKRAALMQVLFQVFYTSLFGMYATFVLLRTGSTVAVILAHAFCNHQGFPDLSFLGAKPRLRFQAPTIHDYRNTLIALYLVGIVAFCWLIQPLTDGFRSSFVPPSASGPR